MDQDVKTATSLCLAAAAMGESAEYFGLYMAQSHGYAFEPQQQQQLHSQPLQQQQHPKPEVATPLTPLTPTTSTSSTNASTTPTSALLTSTTTTTSTGGTPSSAPATPTTASSNASSGSSAGLTPAQLLQWQDMPQYLQFNPYVLRGYRPLQTFKGCLLSLFYWHNETINILTHAIPIVYILAIVPGLMPWDRGYRFLSFCHVFGSVAPWCGSFVYHLFMNIEKGENVYYRLLKLDMVGIWVSQSFGALPLVTATTLCFTPKLKWFIIVSYCLLSLWGLYKALTASSPWQRRLCFALPFSMRSVLTFLRIQGLVGGSHMALSHVYLQDGVSILGGAIGAMRIPEKWFPGLVDFYLNSHNIMHVLVVVAVYSMHKATIRDFEWMSMQTCNSYSNNTEDTLTHVEL
ncbi:progestin and adipoQ receptor family member 4 isoform X2 [Scaptodrosophila lebanonensis]|uniref:Progestin and adipoQ receptor family member 4 isoform X2 n=1 Tax=Drosophila lebanonensis TaxID=7225 RepID=A0A6J2T754_DROLE|nr:progestin and adipoQ receptor family member 4 isoform X2 [Scaptodrosophila lebanonensis]